MILWKRSENNRSIPSDDDDEVKVERDIMRGGE